MTTIVAARLFIDAIVAEHGAIRALLASVDGLVADAPGSRESGTAQLRATLQQLEAALVAHEAHEGRLLFPRLQARCPPLGAVLARMELEHTRMAREIGELLARVPHDAAWNPDDSNGFAKRWEQFAATTAGHMSVEEHYILPVAADFLLREDWDEITS